MNTNVIAVNPSVDKSVKLHARLRKLRISPRYERDKPRLFTQMFTLVNIEDPSGRLQEGMLVRKADHFLLVLSAQQPFP